MKILILSLVCLLFAQVISTGIQNVERKVINGDNIAEFTMNPRNFEVINNETYFISPVELVINHKYSKIACNDNGMKLISFETEEKWLMIKNYLETHGHENGLFWSSGRKNPDGIFMWTETRKPFTFTAWEVGQPDEIEAEEICMNFGPPKQWYDEDCMYYLCYFMCEY